MRQKVKVKAADLQRTVRVDGEMLMKVKVAAAIERTTMAKWLEDAIAQKFNKEKRMR